MTTKKKCGNCAFYQRGYCRAPLPLNAYDTNPDDLILDCCTNPTRNASKCKCYMRAGYTVVDLVHVVLDNPETEISVFANPEDASEYKDDMRGNHVAEEHLVIGRKEMKEANQNHIWNMFYAGLGCYMYFCYECKSYKRESGDLVEYCTEPVLYAKWSTEEPKCESGNPESPSQAEDKALGKPIVLKEGRPRPIVVSEAEGRRLRRAMEAKKKRTGEPTPK